jgi:hypothetical protein
MHYDRQGKEIDFETWGNFFQDKSYQIVTQFEETRGDGTQIKISTVWLGIDHNFLGGPPLIFETIIFGDCPFDQSQWRWTTEQEAIEGHKLIVTAYREGLDPHALVDRLLEENRLEAMH